MNNELIIQSSEDRVQLALLQERELVEFVDETNDNRFSVGDIYIGKIKKLAPDLNAAFIDIGHPKDAFLHYHDLGPQFNSLKKFYQGFLSGKQKHPMLRYFNMEPDINKKGTINEVLKQGDKIMVQITKEPISTKGPRLSSEICLPGRNLVLIPFSNKVSISQRIKESKERDRLERLMESIKPKGFGVIIRTVAQNKTVAELDNDLKELVEKWKGACNGLDNTKTPLKLSGEMSRTQAILRDILNDTFTSILVGSKEHYDNIKNYIKVIAPEKESIVKMYNGEIPAFDKYGVTNQIKALFGKNVSMKSGAYLVIEHTEALHVIDVNSGARVKKEGNQESNAVAVNLEAAKEIARQLRMRDMGGIIVIDFIDMKLAENRKKLYQMLKDEMKPDKAKHKILPPSRFGLIQITRQRVRSVTNIKVNNPCPICNGSGEVQPEIMTINEIENKIRYVLQEKKINKIKLFVHPFVEAYLTKGIVSLQKKWALKYKSWFNIKGNPSYHIMEFHIHDRDNKEINVK